MMRLRQLRLWHSLSRLVTTLAFALATLSAQADDNRHMEQPLTAYLFVYFEGSGKWVEQEQLRFAVSRDAVHWTALNAGRPVVASDTISQSGGIRDPHILRTPDGGFVIVATDMYVARNGWGHNEGIVMLRSRDLVHWTHSTVNLATQWPQRFGQVKWVWAPQTIYDSEADSLLVYFTIAQQHPEENAQRSKLDFFCAYANAQFSALADEPRLMARFTNGAIDGDIVFCPSDSLYHFFYKGNTKNDEGKEVKNGIRQATSPSLRGPWTELDAYIDAYADTPTSVEGSGVFRLNDRDEYILMYDLYTSHRYEFQRSSDLIHFSTTPESFTKDFQPRHGTVIGITETEYQRLLNYRF